MASKVQVQSSDARALFDGTCTGIGVDMFEIARMKHALAAHPVSYTHLTLPTILLV